MREGLTDIEYRRLKRIISTEEREQRTGRMFNVDGDDLAYRQLERRRLLDTASAEQLVAIGYQLSKNNVIIIAPRTRSKAIEV